MEEYSSKSFGLHAGAGKIIKKSLQGFYESPHSVHELEYKVENPNFNTATSLSKCKSFKSVRYFGRRVNNIGLHI